MVTNLGLLGIGVANSVLSGISSAISNKSSYKYASRLQQQQYELQRQLNQNAYQDTTYSMRQAGINPALAIMNGASGGSAGTAGFNASSPDLQSGVSTALAAKQLKNETELKDSQMDVNKALEVKTNYEGDLAHWNSAFAREQAQLLQDYGATQKLAEIENILTNTAKAKQDMANSVRLTESQVGVNSANAAYIKRKTETTPKIKRTGLGAGKFGLYSEEYLYPGESGIQPNRTYGGYQSFLGL